jgi:hypothetical protein
MLLWINCLILFFDWRSSGLFKSFNSITLFFVLRSLKTAVNSICLERVLLFFVLVRLKCLCVSEVVQVQLLSISQVFLKVFWKLFPLFFCLWMLRTYSLLRVQEYHLIHYSSFFDVFFACSTTFNWKYAWRHQNFFVVGHFITLKGNRNLFCAG